MMRSFSIRLMAALIVGISLVSLGSSRYEVRNERATLRSDLEHKAALFGESFAGNAESLWAYGDSAGLNDLVRRFGNRNRDHLLGAAIFDVHGEAVAATPGLHLQQLPMPLLADSISGNRPETEYSRMRLRRVFVLAAPLHSPDHKIIAGMVLVFDTDYIQSETIRIWILVFIHIAIQVLVIAGITFVIVRWSLIRPIARVSRWIRDLRTGRQASAPIPSDLDIFFPLAREMAPLATTVLEARAAAEREAKLRNSGESLWTAERLGEHIRAKLDGSNLYVISNREPYIHSRSGGRVIATVPASGLVTALEPVLRSCHGTWIAHGSGSADVETVDANDRIQVPPGCPEYTLRRVWLSTEEVSGYYNGFANEGLWPLCHIAHTRPVFRSEDWEHYKKVNGKFAAALLEEVGDQENPVVLIQDYHFALLPKLIKDELPHARVAIFWHIPWPNPESFGICPWQKELVSGLLGADLIGFHVQAHCNNFLDTVDRVLEARIDWERFSVRRNRHWTSVCPFPISVEFGEAPAEAMDKKARKRALLEELRVEASYLALGVDRLDYTKGIIERFQAVELLLERYPRYQGQFTLLQVGAPSRTGIPRYADFQAEVEAEALRINERFARGRWQPIVLLNQHEDRDRLQDFYAAADVCLVTSLHDGMNLVAKEFVAAQHDEQGVLILSRFTGAARELRDALIVNPYDIRFTADAIARALAMEPAEAAERMRRMRIWIREHNIFWWAGTFIGALCDLRVKQDDWNRTSQSEDVPVLR